MNKERRRVTGREYKLEKPARQECTAIRGPERQKEWWETGPHGSLGLDQTPSVDLVKEQQQGGPTMV